MNVKLIEPKREHRVHHGPKLLLRRWGAILLGLAIVFFGGIIVECLMFGAVYAVGVYVFGLPNESYIMGVAMIILFIPVAKLFGAWVLPIRY